MYLFSDIYFTDYCLWIQRCPEAALRGLAQQLSALRISKGDVPFDIARLEADVFQQCNQPTSPREVSENCEDEEDEDEEDEADEDESSDEEEEEEGEEESSTEEEEEEQEDK
jgi:hypothetical protein